MKIVYNSFHGRFSDNPRAIYERLVAQADGAEHTWLAHPEHVATFPEGTMTVPIDGPEGIEALESADLVVANTHTEVEWTKRAGATYLQTWHGTPLKRIHRDVLWAPPGRLDRLDRDVARWDLLVSPNPASTPRLRQAFRYEGEILEIGYPRNDVLSSPDADAVAARLRKELDIPEGTKVVLYVPTWRDDEVFGDTGSGVPIALDLADLSRRLGPDHLVLARLHPLMVGLGRVPAGSGVRDVSYYPDVRDLYLIADVLVTDYSSAMFDFAITGRPIVFFAYDLDRFRDTVRGFYFDLVAEAPGPLVTTPDELADALLGPLEKSPRYDAFQERYCALETGHATDRLLSRLGL